MQYLGGKSRIAKQIAAVVAPRGLWWEPFCGGLSVSVQLAKYGPGIVSDTNPALIALYQAVRDGWDPPTSVSEDEYRAAKFLPDSDPRKAFIGFGCSFGGKWFGGYAKGKSYRSSGYVQDYVMCAKKSVIRDVAALSASGSRFDCLAFESATPRGGMTLYLDPPYHGTTRYAATRPFDHDAFWRVAQEWASAGSDVFVSEYTCPVRSELMIEVSQSAMVGRGAARAPATSVNARTERLFRVLPLASTRAA